MICGEIFYCDINCNCNSDKRELKMIFNRWIMGT